MSVFSSASLSVISPYQHLQHQLHLYHHLHNYPHHNPHCHLYHHLNYQLHHHHSYCALQDIHILILQLLSF